MNGGPIGRIVTHGVFELDGGSWEVDNNIWVVGDDSQVVVFDAAHDAGPIVLAVGGRHVVAVVCTHGHNDHVTVAPELGEALDAPVLLHPADEVLWRMTHPDKDFRTVNDGDTLRVAGHELRAIHTPGHSPGSVCWHAPELGAVFSGDTLFEGGPGATGRSYSDFPTILESISNRLATLPADTVVYTGHGDSTTIGDEIIHYDEWVIRGHARRQLLLVAPPLADRQCLKPGELSDMLDAESVDSSPPDGFHDGGRNIGGQDSAVASMNRRSFVSERDGSCRLAFENAALFGLEFGLGQRSRISQRGEGLELLDPDAVVGRRIARVAGRSAGIPRRPLERQQFLRPERTSRLSGTRRPEQRGDKVDQADVRTARRTPTPATHRNCHGRTRAWGLCSRSPGRRSERRRCPPLGSAPPIRGRGRHCSQSLCCRSFRLPSDRTLHQAAPASTSAPAPAVHRRRGCR